MVPGISLSVIESHPAWVRELKLRDEITQNGESVSHPAWVRELKLKDAEKNISIKTVAPRVGA